MVLSWAALLRFASSSSSSFRKLGGTWFLCIMLQVFRGISVFDIVQYLGHGGVMMSKMSKITTVSPLLEDV
jgi:hypothetical protein